MTSLKESGDATDVQEKDLTELPPSGTSLHKRRTGEPPASLTVKGPQTPSDAEGSSPRTAGPTPDDWSIIDSEVADPESICESILQRLKHRDDALSNRGKEVARGAKDTIEALDQLEKLLDLLDQFVALREYNNRMLRKIKDITHLRRLHGAYKKIESENERLKSETMEVDQINEAIDADFEYGQMLFDSMLSGRSMKRTGSKWKGHARFGGSLLRKQRSRSAGGDDSDAAPGTPLRRRSEGVFLKEVEKAKVSKWTRVKSAFRWEKAQWTTVTMGGAVGAVAAGAMVGAVALAGSSPSSATLANPDPRDSASLTPGSALSLTPNSSCEELRMDAGMRKMRSDENDNTFLLPPTQDDSSTSPSPNKLHKTPWGKMRDIIQTHRESVKKRGSRGSTRGSKSSPENMQLRRRSFSDGGDSDAPPVLTLTIPSSEELESEPHPILCKQRSLELGTRPPQHRPPRASKWTKVKRAFLTSASASVPSSPSRHSAFFTDADTEGLSSGGEASGVKEEIARDYAALQTRLGKEFSDRRGKLHTVSYHSAIRPVATEEQLSADFRKKLEEWKLKKGVKQPLPIPARQDLSDDFLKRWDAWKRMKDTNTVPAWEEEPKPDEVLVQTSTGLFKFQGISRSFTRKLHEWEKSRGIAPEASTSALLQAARAQKKVPQATLTRTQSDGSVAPSAAGSGRHHASSLSVNDVDDFESEYERDQSMDGLDDEENTRGALLVEVEAEEVCTAAPLMAVSPRHTPQKPVYTYGQAEARLLCETSSAVTGTAVLQPNGAVFISEDRALKPKETGARPKTTVREQIKTTEKPRRRISRQTSIEEDAKLIRKAIEEVERGSSRRLIEEDETHSEKDRQVFEQRELPPTSVFSIQKSSKQNNVKELLKDKTSTDDLRDDKRKDADKNNGKKKVKSRARLEREQSKPSETDTDPEVDTVTVEIPRRKKRLRRASEKPRTPPTSLHSDSEGEVFVLKLKAPEQRDRSPEVIVKTTRKIFSPVVRSGESVPRAVIPVDVEDLDDVRPESQHKHDGKRKESKTEKGKEKNCRKVSDELKGSGDLQEPEDQKKRSRPPLPSSPSSQRKPQPKETAPSIRIMIQRYNKKINEEGHTSGENSGASSPAWRSPSAERRRPPDMPVGVNIRNNPFLEREVQKSASACQLSRRDQTSAEKPHTPTPSTNLDGVLKSHSANALVTHKRPQSPEPKEKIEDSQETIIGTGTTASIDTIVPDLPKNLPKFTSTTTVQSLPVMRQFSETVIPTYSRLISESPSISSIMYGRSASTVDAPVFPVDPDATGKISERAAKIKAARDRFLLSSGSMRRREGTSSVSDLRRTADRSSTISCDSDVAESQSSSSQNQDSNLGRSASTGMVNVDQEAWQRVAEGGGRSSRSRSRFSLARLTAKLRRSTKDESAVSRLCRQSLLVQLINKH